jgi:hypothetical protein
VRAPPNDVVGPLMEQASAIYEPMALMGWIGAEPANRRLAWKPGAAVPSDWSDVVLLRQLACGLIVTAERRGFTIYDFARWRPGVPRYAGSTGGLRFRTVKDGSQARKPALVSRLRVIDSHLTLLHAAAMVQTTSRRRSSGSTNAICSASTSQTTGTTGTGFSRSATACRRWSQ